MKDSEVKVNDHVWAVMEGELLIAIKQKDGYSVCGDWEGTVDADEFDYILSIIPKPNNLPLYYGKG